MRDLRLLIEGTSVLASAGNEGRTTSTRMPLKVVEQDIYGKLARRRRKAQMAARRALGVHDDLLSRQSIQG
jgi:LmbE family N-acetylglucosaminyl deacetylase